ncbi:MAG: hypothetical protein CMJ58_01500 [Planctomycetaceae bacterium]|nr:hypothetical protein [Planctomycetaceae bacterium]
MPTITERRRDAVKQGIYEAAVEVLTRDGLDGATMDRVAAEAGICKGSLYNYFKDKTHILEFVFDKTIEPLNESIDQIVDSKDCAVAKLRAVFREILEYLGPRRKLFSFLMGQQPTQQLMTPRRSTGPPTLAQLIHQGIQQGVFRKCDPLFHATLIYGGMQAVADNYVNLGESKTIDESVELITDFFVSGILASPQNAGK